VVLARRGDTVAEHQPVEAVAPPWWDRPVETDWSDGTSEGTLFG
jgi:hypothetical protein